MTQGKCSVFQFVFFRLFDEQLKNEIKMYYPFPRRVRKKYLTVRGKDPARGPHN